MGLTEAGRPALSVSGAVLRAGALDRASRKEEAPAFTSLLSVTRGHDVTSCVALLHHDTLLPVGRRRGLASPPGRRLE